MEQSREYPMKVYPLETENGLEWAVEFLDIPGCVGGGKTPEEAIGEAKENLEVHLQLLKKMNLPIPSPSNEDKRDDFKGKIVFRTTSTKHKELHELAKKENVSINTLINEFVSEGITKRVYSYGIDDVICDVAEDVKSLYNSKTNAYQNVYNPTSQNGNLKCTIKYDVGRS